MTLGCSNRGRLRVEVSAGQALYRRNWLVRGRFVRWLVNLRARIGADVIEEVMIFALGFLAASLIALAVAPAFWRRAIRLSKRRLEMQLPLSPEEILAQRDLLRAEFVVECRKLEQKAHAINACHAGDMAELGRRAATIAYQETELRALAQQNNDLGKELITLQRALAETSGELAMIAKESYDSSGLFARKDFEIRDLKAALEDAQALSAKQRNAIEALEANVARQKHALVAETAKIAHLENELSTSRLQHQADQVGIKAAAAKIADREEALRAAEKREKEAIRLRNLQGEAARAAEGGYLEKIERLRNAHGASQEALATMRRTCDRLTKELLALRDAAPMQDAAAANLLREENEVLRQKISEIGTAVIRAAGEPAEAEPADHLEKNAPEGHIPEKETA
jgi:chromosome segregation ATPase